SEYSRGKTLAVVLAQQGPLGLRRVLPIARQLASVLVLAHSARVRHGDLTLSGIWVESPLGRPDWIRMLDFGLCELPPTDGPTAQSGVFQSPFRRPEAGSVFCADAVRWDTKCFGSALYELALGSPPRSTANVSAAFEAQLPDLGRGAERALVRSFAKLVERCLVPVPEVAYRGMDEVFRDLEALTQALEAAGARALEARVPVTSIHAPARRARVAVGGPKVIVRG
ncbi:MAG TPA: hypothetical protein VMG12_32160, partial [Polyangiaceae bacterium]|nr:hypothetical protein [Polyangiaceae bacterium]